MDPKPDPVVLDTVQALRKVALVRFRKFLKYLESAFQPLKLLREKCSCSKSSQNINDVALPLTLILCLYIEFSFSDLQALYHRGK